MCQNSFRPKQQQQSSYSANIEILNIEILNIEEKNQQILLFWRKFLSYGFMEGTLKLIQKME